MLDIHEHNGQLALEAAELMDELHGIVLHGRQSIRILDPTGRGSRTLGRPVLHHRHTTPGLPTAVAGPLAPHGASTGAALYCARYPQPVGRLALIKADVGAREHEHLARRRLYFLRRLGVVVDHELPGVELPLVEFTGLHVGMRFFGGILLAATLHRACGGFCRSAIRGLTFGHCPSSS
jgi:hypothetical protein